VLEEVGSVKGDRVRKLWVVSVLLLLASLPASAETLKDCRDKCLLGAKNCHYCCEERAIAAAYKCFQPPLSRYAKCANKAKTQEEEKACEAVFDKETARCRDVDNIDISKEKCDERWGQKQ
jgi:hypothetical protein